MGACHSSYFKYFISVMWIILALWILYFLTKCCNCLLKDKSLIDWNQYEVQNMVNSHRMKYEYSSNDRETLQVFKLSEQFLSYSKAHSLVSTA